MNGALAFFFTSLKSPQGPVFWLRKYRYSIHNVTATPYETSVVRPRAEIRTQGRRSEGTGYRPLDHNSLIPGTGIWEAGHHITGQNRSWCPRWGSLPRPHCWHTPGSSPPGWIETRPWNRRPLRLNLEYLFYIRYVRYRYPPPELPVVQLTNLFKIHI